MKKLLIIIMLLFPIIALSQVVGIGTGYTSRGVVPLLISYTHDNFGGYIKLIDEENEYNEFVAPSPELDEYSIGVSYKVFDRLLLFADIGKGTKTEYIYTITSSKTYIDFNKTNQMTIGFGFNAIVYQGSRIDVGIGSIFSTFSTLSTLVILRLDLTK